MYGQKNYIYTVKLSQQAAKEDQEIKKKNPAWNPGQPLAYVGLHAKSPLKLFAGEDFSESRHSLVRNFGECLLKEYYTTKVARRAVLRAEEQFILELRGRGYGVKTRPQTRNHCVYVVELSPEAISERFESSDNASSPSSKLPPVYVGMTSKSPKERFKQHKTGGHKTNKKVRKFGVRLRPDLYEGLNPMIEREALRTEKALKNRLERIGFPAFGGT